MWKILGFTFILFSSQFLYSQNINIIDHEKNKNLINEKIKNIKDMLMINSEIKPLGNSGFYYFEDKENKIVIIDKNGEYFFRTNKQEIFKLKNKDIISKPNFNIEDTFYNYEILKNIDKEKIIRYVPDKYNPMKELFVFIDYTCPYCKDFHEDVLIPLVDNGYTVNYLPIARNFRNKNVINNLKVIFCNKDKKLLNRAFKEQGRFNTDKKCDNNKYYDYLIQLAYTFDIIGTPAIFTKDGRYLGGLKPLPNLIKQIENKYN
tara:strand:- start:115137 stop:115919 length:783 start_codon:yes stop_codon:yes gene_type:complete